MENSRQKAGEEAFKVDGLSSLHPQGWDKAGQGCSVWECVASDIQADSWVSLLLPFGAWDMPS